MRELFNVKLTRTKETKGTYVYTSDPLDKMPTIPSLYIRKYSFAQPSSPPENIVVTVSVEE